MVSTEALDFRGVRIAVVGDVMLDHYIYGEVTRISPEAPVPVVLKQKEEWSLGGAANVALNCKKLGCEVYLFGRGSLDHNSEIVDSLLDESGVGHWSIAKGPTAIKTRIMCGGQQLLRLDSEVVEWITNEMADDIYSVFSEHDRFDAIIISDYAKGVCTPYLCQKLIWQQPMTQEECEGMSLEELKAAKTKKRIPVLVDPKGTDWIKYAEAFCIKPNESELKALNDPYLRLSGGPEDIGTVRRWANTHNLVVTRGMDGMTLCDSEGTLECKPDKSLEVRDVCGAGDTVIATLAACVGKGMTMCDAVPVAVKAASIVVQKRGVKPITIEELREA